MVIMLVGFPVSNREGTVEGWKVGIVDAFKVGSILGLFDGCSDG